MPQPLEELNQRFAIPGLAEVVAGNQGLPKIVITSGEASAEVYLHGAQVTSWIPAQATEVIFLSERSKFADGSAIRGGVPICFPWFRGKTDNPKAPSHGFVRTKAWELESIKASGAAVTVTLSTKSDDATRVWWPYDFLLQHQITVDTQLKMALLVTNTGNLPFTFEEALHTYHRVGDASTVRVAGLDGVHFLDNTDGNREKTQQGEVIFTKQTDNAYVNTSHSVEIVDPELHRRILTTKENSLTTVVWNPWIDGAHSLSDLGDDEWRQMACAEASNIRDLAVTLQPGKQHGMSATLSVASL